MKPTIKTNLGIKFLAFSLILFSTYNLALAQQRPQQNIRRVTVTNQYVLENGNKTSKFWAVYQEAYDSLGRLHTEVDRNFPDHSPHKYTWHTFKGKQKVKTDFFENEKLQMIKEFTYNKDSLISQEVIKIVKPNDTSLFLTLNYKYNQLKKPIQIDAKKPDNKTAYTIKSTFDSRGSELTRKVKVSKGYLPFDSIISMNSKPHYDSIGRLVGGSVNIVKTDNKGFTNNFTYKYDKRNNIIEITIRDGKGILISHEERLFHPTKNRLSQIKYYNSNNSLIKWLEKRYEIYRTNDTSKREIDY